MEVHGVSLSEIEQVFFPLGTKLSENSDFPGTYSIKARKCGDKRHKAGNLQFFRGDLTYEEAVTGLKYAFTSLNNNKYFKMKFKCSGIMMYSEQTDFHSDAMSFQNNELTKNSVGNFEKAALTAFREINDGPDDDGVDHAIGGGADDDGVDHATGGVGGEMATGSADSFFKPYAISAPTVRSILVSGEEMPVRIQKVVDENYRQNKKIRLLEDENLKLKETLDANPELLAYKEALESKIKELEEEEKSYKRKARNEYDRTRELVDPKKRNLLMTPLHCLPSILKEKAM
jgi:hypothetical protein